jgi:hypothetical protein
MLYDSLATPGYLVLGEVETPTSNLREKLECLDAKAKIYKKTRGGSEGGLKRRWSKEDNEEGL